MLIWSKVNLKLLLIISNLLLVILSQYEKLSLIRITTPNAFQLLVKMEFIFGNSSETFQ